MSKKNEKKKGEKAQRTATVSGTPKGSEGDAAALRLQQIRTEEQVERIAIEYQRKLEVQKADFSSRYSRLELDMKDVVQYLKRCVAQLEDELAEVSERLVSEQRTWEEHKRSLDLQLIQLHQDHQKKSDELSSENVMLAGKLASLEEFAEQKERLISDLSSLEEKLANEKDASSSIIHELERKAVLEKERWRVEHAEQAKQAPVEQQQAQQSHPLEAVWGCRLAREAKQSLRLLRENQALRDSETLLRNEETVSKTLIEHFSHQQGSNRMVIKRLTERCHQLGVELKEKASICQGLQQIEAQHNLLLAETHALREEHKLVLEQGRKDAAAARRLEAELEEERSRRGQTESLLREAAVALRRALTGERKEEEKEEEPGLEGQEEEVLLAILNRAVLLDVDGGVMNVLSEKHPAPTSARAHYRPGDLGLVPRQNHTSRGSKVGSHSRITSQPRGSQARRVVPQPWPKI